VTSPSGASPLPVILDAMGGDHAPSVTVEAARLACERGLGPVTLVGDPERVNLGATATLPQGLTFLEAPEVIGMSESPARAARAKPQSSMHIGMRALKEGKGCAFVTAGNSGAALAVGLVLLKRIEGCERPAIASLMPSLNEPIVLLDMGANVTCKASHLAQFAIMGATYASQVLGRTRPRVGLLSNGQEPSKGTEQLREAHRLLTRVDMNYLGYVEGQALPLGQCDVVVTDGFVGNVALKLSEGVVEAMTRRVKREFESRWWTKLLGGLVRSTLAPLTEELDWRRIGGAPILGLKHTTLICHGGSDAEALCSAIERARRYAQHKLPQLLHSALEPQPFSGSLSTTSEILSGRIELERRTEELDTSSVDSTEP